MKRRFLTIVAGLGLISVVFVSSAMAQVTEDGFSKWAALHAVPLTTIEPGADLSDLLPLQSAIGQARVVALGEPTHGVHEPLAFRNRLLRFLVDRMGFTAIAIESGFTEAAKARPFIESGEGDVGATARMALPGLDSYLETLELLQWIRDYNATAATRGHHPLRLYGIDIPAGGRRGGPWSAIDSALTYLSRADAASATRIRDSMTDQLPRENGPGFGPLSAAAQAQFEAAITAIAKAMQRSRKDLLTRTSSDEYRWAQHNLETARQSAKCLAITPPPGAGMSVWAYTTACRDAAMAKNVQWELKNEGPHGRILVFAHLGHVVAGRDNGRRMNAVTFKPPMMGWHLRREYGNNYYVIAMSAAKTGGGFRAAKPPEEGSVESTLASTGLPLFFLDVRTARKSKQAFAWLSTPRGMDANVDAQGLITLSSAVDSFIFVETLTPAVLASVGVP